MISFTKPLPDSVTVDGVQYKVRTGFKTWLAFLEIYEDSRPFVQKCAELLKLCYMDTLPPTLIDAVEAMMRFFSCGREQKRPSSSAASMRRIVDFKEDAEWIYASFLSVYGLDLFCASLHWWQFTALFSALPDDCRICQVMHYRAVDLSSVKDKEQKAFYRRMKRLYALPDNRSEEVKEAALSDAFASFF